MKKLLSLTVVLVMIMTILPTAGIITVSAAGTGVNALSIAGTDTLYEEFDYSDPNWVTDEELFGEWNSETETWTTESLLNYEKYSAELSEVEAAAKAGDYALAGQIVTEYYRQKFLSQPRTITKTSAVSATISAKMLCYNMYGAGSFTNYDIVTLTEDEQLVKADITAAAQSAANSTSGKEYSFQIAATHDDGYTAYMLSRESDFAPYVEANVDGNNVTFPVIADTYIRGGQYKSINYGTEETNPENKLYMQEHTDFSGSGVKYPATKFDWSDVNLDGIMRTRLTVDFSTLARGSSVNSAKLCFTGASDNPAGKTVVIQYKADMGGSETDASWTWSGAPRYMMSYWGFAGTVAFSGDNSTKYNRYVASNWGAATALTGVYRYTMDETYAYHAFRYMNALVNEQGYDPSVAARGSGTWNNNLSLATRSSDLPVHLAQLATSVHFTAENFLPMLKYAYSSGQQLVERWDSQSEGTNWGTYETAGLSNLVVNFKEFRIVDEPMIEGGVYGRGNTGGWLALVNHRYYIISGEVLRADDSFTETMGYGKETFNNFLKYPKYAEQAGEPVFLDEPLMQNMNKLAAYIINVSRPGFTSTQYGDSYAYGAKFNTVALDAAKLTGDEFLWWAGTFGKQGTPPSHTSIFYPVNRKLISRTGWGTYDLMIDFACDNRQMGHNHPDDLNINLFCYGEPLLVDSMQYSYGTNAPERNAVYATAMHNTLSIKVTDPVTGYRENLSHIQNISGIYTGPYPVYSEDHPQENWPRAWFNRANHDGHEGVVYHSELNNGYDHVEMGHDNYAGWKLTNPEYSYATSNVDMKRSMLTVRHAKYVLVTDYVTALDDNDYTVVQNWHFLPASGFYREKEDDYNNAVKAEFETTGIAKTNFGTDKANIQIVPVKAQSQLDYVYEMDGYYCRTQGVIQRNPYPAYEKPGSGDKVFNTLLLPTAGGEEMSVNATNLQMDVPETTASASRITMTDTKINKTREVYYYFLHDEMQKAQRNFGTYSTDAKMSLIEHYEGAPTLYILQKGTNIVNTSNQKTLVKSNELVEDLSVTIGTRNINLDTSKELNLEALTIRAESPVTQVLLNGEAVQFKQADNYIYFGDTPILSDPTISVPDDNAGTNSPSHGGGGSGAGSSGGSGGGGGGGGSTTPKPDDKEEKPESGETPDDGNGSGSVETTPSASDFMEELSNHWGEKEISTLVEKGVVKGDNGKLNLKNSVTRAELLALITRAMGIEEKEYSGEFADVKADDWFAGAISAAKAAGLVDGDGENVMPNQSVTREQMAKFLVTAYIYKNGEIPEGEAITFDDSHSISDWAAEFINKATSLGILNGMGDGNFAPKNAVLREQAFAAIARLIK